MTNEQLVSRIQAGDREQMETLLSQNRGILYALSNRYLPAAQRNRGLDMDDLLQAAALGMIEAVPKWEESRGGFLTVAVFHIRRSIREALGIHSSKERLENTGILSLDESLSCKENVSLLETLPDQSAVDPAEAAEEKDMVRIVREAVERLPSPYRETIKANWFGEGPRDKNRIRTAEALLRKDAAIHALHEAAPYHHRGLASFRITHTSATEAAAMRWETLNEQHTRPGEPFKLLRKEDMP